MHWKTATILICAFGTVKEFRPASPFITPYLLSPLKNFTDVQLYSEIYPFWTYSYLVALIPIFFLTDLLRYKPIVMLEAVSLCATWAILVWGKTIWQMQIMQIFFGVASASEIAYESYLYAIVDEKYYKMAASYTRAATLLGRIFAYALGQFIVSFRVGDLLSLNQMSLCSVSVIILIAIALPTIPSRAIANKVRSKHSNDVSRIFSESETQENGLSYNDERVSLESKPAIVEYGIVAYFRGVWNHFEVFHQNRVVLRWSIWWALTSCGIYQVMNYVQNLWAIMQTEENTYNGIVEFAYTVIGAIITFSVQYLRINWALNGEYILFGTSGFISALLIASSQTNNIYFAYTVFVIVIAIYNLLITAASANIALELDSSSYGLIFGWNTFLAMILQTILTLVVADKHGFSLTIRNQFVVYGCYFAVITVIFAFVISLRIFKQIFHHTSHTSDSQTTDSDSSVIKLK